MKHPNSKIRTAPVGAPITIDVEASGFGPGSYPIEVGIALADATRHCYLVMPVRSWNHWDPDAESVHGITRDSLLTYGRPVRDIAWRLNELLRFRTVYSDGWGHDVSWIGKLFEAANVQQRFRIADVAELMSEAQMSQWHAVKQQVTERLGLQRHRASGDARILQETLRLISQTAA